MTREKSDPKPISISHLKSSVADSLQRLKSYTKNNSIPSTNNLNISSAENQISNPQNIHAPPPIAFKKNKDKSINNINQPIDAGTTPNIAGQSTGNLSGHGKGQVAGHGKDQVAGHGISKKPNIDRCDDIISDLNQYELHLERNFPCIEKMFSDNLDILELDDFLMKKFEFEKETKTRLLRKQIEIEKQKLEEPHYLIEIKIIQNDILEMEKEYHNLMNHNKINEYKRFTKEIFEYYNQIGHKKKVISFNNTKQNKKEDVWNSKIRKFLLEKYLDIFKRYHEIHISHTQSLKPICQVCQYDLTKIISEEAGVVVCPKCNTEKTMLIHTSIVSEVKYMNSKDGYEDRENFWKALQRFQGKQNNHIPERLYKELDEYFKSFGLAIGKEICSMELTRKGTRGNTSRGMMFKALSETNNSVFYEDVNLICHLYWGWLLPDISADEEQIMNDYDMTQEVFKKIPKDRRSSLNAQYRLWQHLRVRGYKYPIDDFKIVKTPDILVEHDRIMRIMCEECNLPFISAL